MTEPFYTSNDHHVLMYCSRDLANIKDHYFSSFISFLEADGYKNFNFLGEIYHFDSLEEYIITPVVDGGLESTPKEIYMAVWAKSFLPEYGNAVTLLSMFHSHGINFMPSGETIKSSQTQLIATQSDPTLQRKHGAPTGNQNAAKTEDKNKHSYNYVCSQERGSPYLLQRIAEVRPDVLEKVEAGEYSSARAAAIDAGILKPRVQVTWKGDATDEQIAKALIRKLSDGSLKSTLVDFLENHNG